MNLEVCHGVMSLTLLETAPVWRQPQLMLKLLMLL